MVSYINDLATERVKPEKEEVEQILCASMTSLCKY